MCSYVRSRKGKSLSFSPFALVGFPHFALALVLLRLAAPTWAQNNPATKPAASHVAASHAESDLLKLARDNGANILIDATKLSDTPFAPVSAQIKGPGFTVHGEAVYYADGYRLSNQALGHNTYIFWPEPDEAAVARALAAGQGFGREEDDLDTASLVKRIHETLNPQRPTNTDNAKAAQGGAGLINEEVRLSQLPLELQQKVVESVVNQRSPEAEELWLRDETWNHAAIVYRPADPHVGGSWKTFFLTCEEGDNTRDDLCYVDAFTGGAGRSSIRPHHTQLINGVPRPNQDPEPVKAPLAAGQQRLRVVKEFDKPEAPAEALVNTPLRSAGVSLQSLQHSSLGLDLQGVAELSTPLTLEITCQPLSRVLQTVAEQTHTPLKVAPEVEAENSLLTAHVQALAASDFLTAVAHMFSLRWEKGADGTLMLTSSGSSAIEKELRRFGDIGWYRFRNNNTTTLRASKDAFDQIGAKIVDQAGPNILNAPGVMFTSLPADLQAALREKTETALMRQIVRSQVGTRDILQGNWTVRLTGRMVTPDPNSPPTYEPLQIECLRDGQAPLATLIVGNRFFALHPAAMQVQK